MGSLVDEKAVAIAKIGNRDNVYGEAVKRLFF